LLYRYIRQEARVFERTLRLKASRPMPINWTIPVRFKLYTRVDSPAYDWNVSEGVQPLTMNKGQTLSPLTSILASQGQDTAGMQINNSSPPEPNYNSLTGADNRITESASYLIVNFNSPTATFGNSTDTDQDGLPNFAELSRGTDPTKKDSDNNGQTDGQDAVPTIYQFENYDIVSRSSQYNFDGTESSGYT
jgi:hypothetical protein